MYISRKAEGNIVATMIDNEQNCTSKETPRRKKKRVQERKKETARKKGGEMQERKERITKY